MGQMDEKITEAEEAELLHTLRKDTQERKITEAEIEHQYDCTDCGDKIALTDVEGHYSGRCAHCRNRNRLEKLSDGGYT